MLKRLAKLYVVLVAGLAWTGAVFAQATAHFGNFDLTLGARYTRDDKSAAQQGLNTRPGVPPGRSPRTRRSS